MSELTYTKVGDYYIPDLTLSEADTGKIGKYGRMREHFLKEHHSGRYSCMLLEGTLWSHLSEVDSACYEQLDAIATAMAKREGVTESIKAADPMEWVARMNSIRHRAEEMVLHDLVYTLILL